MNASTARQQMTDLTKAQRTPLLCQALIALDADGERSAEKSIVRAAIIDVLCERHPEVDAAFEAWAEQETNTETAVQAITGAALAAHRSR
ncbi:hypothetical protein ACFFMN_23380 [Planobispora siamensis]|uniref:Uncharacterized protein n=1 Tax=Planobispora siamensis TaxID=936338 RepID=A0A8J3SIU0_9ACTN|nr:hypothetical protein [Planobispora siamensis]GIH95306.1 hypothetical protein Psi01_59360 [Planobispora siamensis]